jgi:hypothetical protein
LQIKPELAHLVGIDIGTVNCRVAVTDFLGKIPAFKKLRSEAQEGPEHVPGLIHSEIQAYRQEFPKITAMGIAQSGFIQHVTGTVLFWPKVWGWQDVPLMVLLEREHRLPTMVKTQLAPWPWPSRRLVRGGASRISCTGGGGVNRLHHFCRWQIVYPRIAILGSTILLDKA